MTGARLALIGAGRMGRALLGAWTREAAGAGTGEHPRPIAIDPDLSSRDAAEALGARALLAPTAEALADIDTMVLAVKPQAFGAVAETLAPFVAPGVLVISLLAGVRMAELQRSLPRARVVRAMPNTPALVGKGVTAYVCAADVTEDQRARTHALLSAAGEAIALDDEALLDAVTAVSGSGPAYVFALAEAMEAAGVAEGLAPELARRLAYATVTGAGALLERADADAASLRASVTSPGGTTEAALAELLGDEGLGALGELLRRAVAAAAVRARELGG